MTGPVAAGVLAVQTAQTVWTDEQRDALAHLGADRDATRADLAMFLTVCQRTGLDPFARQIYLVGRWDKRERRKRFSIQTGIDGFRVVAARSPRYAGQSDPEWCGQDTGWVDHWDSETPPVAARVGVFYTDQPDRPIRGVAHWREYAPYFADRDTGELVLGGMWAQMPALMLAKCAEALALRKAFPQDLSGVYAPEEMRRDRSRPVIDVPPAGSGRGRNGGTPPAANPATSSASPGDLPRDDVQPPAGLTDLIGRAQDADDVDTLRMVWRDARAAGLVDAECVDIATGEQLVFGDYLNVLRLRLEPDDVDRDDPDGVGGYG